MGFGGQFCYYHDYSGRYLLGHRYFDSFAGRFVTRDPIGYAGGINLYSLGDSNPVNNSDPNGTDWNTTVEPAGEWIDNHLLGGSISNWGNTQGLYDSGRATLAQRNWAAVRGSAEVVGLATSVVGGGAGVRLVVRGIGERALTKTLARESDEILLNRISGKNLALKGFWGTGGDDAIDATNGVRNAKFYHLPKGVNRQTLLAYREVIKRNVSKRLWQNTLRGKVLPENDPGLRRRELIDLALHKTQYR